MLAVRMRGQSRSPFNSSLSKEKRRTRAAQYTRFVEPDSAMPNILLALASFGFVYQRERAITCSLREPEEVLRSGRLPALYGWLEQDDPPTQKRDRRSRQTIARGVPLNPTGCAATDGINVLAGGA